MAEVYLLCLRRRWPLAAKMVGLLLNCQINCCVLQRLFLPHPIATVADTMCCLGNDVVLLQCVTLGGRHPYHRSDRIADRVDPILKDGVYVGPRARVLGPITVGEWSIIGANAVVTLDIPPSSIVVGHNRVLSKKTTDL
jgi:serine acetyltransferase